MFTGIVEEIGRIARIEERPAGRRLWIEARHVLEDTKEGDSLAVNGCCLTVTTRTAESFTVDVVPETLARTTIGEWREGDEVNLERALRADARLGGHFVQGHVDGVAVTRGVVPEGDGVRLALEVPEALLRFVAEKGSLAVDGTSLTVARLEGRRCEIALVPHTLKATVASRYGPGHRVHVEVDLLSRYLVRWLEETRAMGSNR